MHYWVMRTDRSWAEGLINPELLEGRLRQGWGSSPAQNLRAIETKLERGLALDACQAAAWRRNRRLLPEQPDGLKSGDLVLLPHLPRDGRWTLARAGTSYAFDVSPMSNDHGHVRDVEVVLENISPWSEPVSAPLRRTMRCQLPLWNVDHLAADIDRLQESASDLRAAVGPDIRMAFVIDAADRAASAELLRQFAAAELEAPVGAMLVRHFDNVRHVAGPAEHGADFICEAQGPLGFRQLVAVQVKAWQGAAYDTAVFDQLRQAKARWPDMTGGLVLTTADRTTDAFLQAAGELAGEIDAEIRVLCLQDVVALLRCSWPDPRARPIAYEPNGAT